MDLILSLVINAIIVLVLSYILPGVTVNSFMTALLVAIVLGIINALVGAAIKALPMPMNAISYGLITLVVSALVILVTDTLVAGFRVANFWYALLFAIALALANSLIGHYGGLRSTVVDTR